MDIAQGQYLPCDLCDFSSLPLCQNKPLHHSSKDLNHLSTGTSSCYLDNCQQEHAEAPSCFLINKFTHLVAAWGCQNANNIYRLLCGAIQGRLSVADCLTEADSTLNLRSLQIDSAVSSSQGSRVCRVAVNQGIEHNTIVHTNWSNVSLHPLNMYWIIGYNSYKNIYVM